MVGAWEPHPLVLAVVNVMQEKGIIQEIQAINDSDNRKKGMMIGRFLKENLIAMNFQKEEPQLFRVVFSEIELVLSEKFGIDFSDPCSFYAIDTTKHKQFCYTFGVPIECNCVAPQLFTACGMKKVGKLLCNSFLIAPLPWQDFREFISIF